MKTGHLVALIAVVGVGAFVIYKMTRPKTPEPAPNMAQTINKGGQVDVNIPQYPWEVSGNKLYNAKAGTFAL